MKGQAALEALLLAACLLAAIAAYAGALNAGDWGARAEKTGGSCAACLGIEALAAHARAATGSGLPPGCLAEARPGEYSMVVGAIEKR